MEQISPELQSQLILVAAAATIIGASYGAAVCMAQGLCERELSYQQRAKLALFVALFLLVALHFAERPAKGRDPNYHDQNHQDGSRDPAVKHSDE